VRGDPGLGAVLRGLRASRLLTQTQVATRVCCDASLVSMVESGKRALQPDLAQRLDHLYGTGTTITSLAGPGALPGAPGRATLEGSDDLVLIQLPLRGVMVPVPRRALLAALSTGVTTGALPGLRGALDDVPADEALLTEQAKSLRALHAAGRVLPPAQLVDPLIGQVTVLDAVRHRAPAHLRRDYLMLAAQYAENLSRLVQESGDPTAAATWIDRAQHWADRARWPAMSAYTHVRRSILASTCAGGGRAVVEHAAHALRAPDAPRWVRAEAAKQVAYGHALTGRPDACDRYLDLALALFDGAPTHDEDPDPIIGLHSGLDMTSLLAQFQGTCDVYLGGGEHAAHLLTPALATYRPGSRPHAIASARLARAHAQAGDPDQACALALQAVDTGQALDSRNTRVELRRTLKPLDRWPGREDVAEVRHRITTLG
jgi:transcriptional regulator with XRE-family HTH domain